LYFYSLAPDFLLFLSANFRRKLTVNDYISQMFSVNG